MQARRGKEAKLFGLSTGLLHFAFLQILIGALVAGIDAGRAFTDWPLMGGQILPPEQVLSRWWRNCFEKPGAGAVHSPDVGLSAVGVRRDGLAAGRRIGPWRDTARPSTR